MADVTAQNNVNPVELEQQKLTDLYNQRMKWQLSLQSEAAKQAPNDLNLQNQYVQTMMQNDPFQQQITMQQTAIKNAQLKAEGKNPDGSPIAPEFQTILDKDGNLPDKYKYNPALLDPNSLEGYNLLKQIATQQGPSKYAEAANKQIDLGRQDQIDAATQQAGGASAKARSDLAMRGGLGGGARERIAADAMNNTMGATQNAYRGANNSLLDVMKQDELMKRDALSKFGEAEGKIAFQNNATTNQGQQYNLGTLLKEEDMRRSYTMDTYKSVLDKWAANKQAEATRSSGGGGK